MKTKRTNRLIALILVAMMLVPMISIPTTAWDIDPDAIPFLKEDFNAIEQNGDTIAVSTDENKTNITGAHLYSRITAKADDENDKFVLVPFKGIGSGLKPKFDEEGNPVMEDKRNEFGQRIPYPVMVDFLDADGNPVKDADGNVLQVQATEVVMKDVMTEELDEEGNVVIGDDGEPVMVPKKDPETGEKIQEPVMEIAYKYELDEYGRPKRELTEPKNGSYGNYVYQTDENGNKLYEVTDEPLLDANGNPLYDADGNPMMKPATRPQTTFVIAYEQTQAMETYNEGNYDKYMTVNNNSVAASDKGIVLEMDVLLHYEDMTMEECGYEYSGNAEAPMAEIQFKSVSHTKVGTSTSTSNISMAKINLKTGELSNVGNKVPGVANLKQDTWYNIKFVIDLVLGTYTTYVNGEQWAIFGYVSTGNSSSGLTNIGINAGQLVIAKCSKS
ncbi:MAG: hypothetical protein IJX80_04140, partial [Clostridia bacterium]|nr:hypothetical protein [Clostridia bacterium]